MVEKNELIGQTIGSYKITTYIGGGGMSEGVYRATHVKLENTVAIKVMDIGAGVTQDRRKRISDEPRRTASLNHPNIVRVLDVIEEGPRLYMVMEYIEGKSLLQIMMENRKDTGREAPGINAFSPLSKEYTASIIGQVGRALDYAHNHGIIHRDVKPANILITPDNRAVLSDFGIAKAIEATELSITHEGVGVGTPPYMSPEQIKGHDPTPASDEYSLAIVAYQMLTGRAPFEGASSMVIAHKHLTEEPPSPRSLNPDISQATETVLLKALSKNPKDRFGRAGTFTAKLTETLATTSAIRLPTLSFWLQLKEKRGWGILHHIWRRFKGFWTWVAETLVRSIVYVVLGTILFIGLVILGGTMLISSFIENQIADYNWSFNENDQAITLTSMEMVSDLNRYGRLYLPGYVQIADMTITPPSMMTLTGEMLNMAFVIDAQVVLKDGYPNLTILTINEKPATFLVSLLGGGVNRGFQKALDQSAATMTSLTLQDAALIYQVDAPEVVADQDELQINPSGILLQDDFSDLESGWPRRYVVEAARTGYDNGKYRIDIFQPNFMVLQQFPTSLTQFEISVDAELKEGPTTTQYGVALFVRGDQDYVSVLMTSDGFCMIGLTEGGSTRQLLGWVNTDVEASNNIRVAVTTREISLYINDAEIATVDYTGTPMGNIGLIAQTGLDGAATVTFDNLLITAQDR